MIAADVMVEDVITIAPEASVAIAARLMTDNDVSALPVVDAEGQLVGIISEADLLRREEIGTAAPSPRWVETMTPATTLAADFAKSHAKRVADVMSSEVISVAEDAPLNEIAALLERHRIKRVPVVRDGKPVGIVSRSNLIQALASVAVATEAASDGSRSIREELLSRLREQSWTNFSGRNVIVKDGEVHLWGLVWSEDERKALIVLAESIPGVTNVVDETIHLAPVPAAAAEPAGRPAGEEGDGVLTATAATVAVVGLGAAALEVALLPGIAIGVAAAWLPKYFPDIVKSTVRSAYRVGQKTREMATRA